MITTTAASGLVLAAGDPMSHVVPHTLVKFGEYALTNHILMLLVSAVLLLIFIPMAARKDSLVPTGFRNLLEAVMQFIREEVARPLLGSKTDTYIPYLWTFFFLIATANVLGLIPLGMMAAPIDKHLMHIGGTATGNLGITIGLAIFAFFLIHIGGMKEQGVGKYWKNFYFGHGPAWLAPLMIPLETVSAFIKPFALAMRLFANMTGGHIVVAVLTGFAVWGILPTDDGGGGGGVSLLVSVVSVVGALGITLLELFVALLQAYIFTFLTTLFLGMAVNPEH